MERNRAVGKLTARSYHPLKTEPWVGSKYVDKCDFIRMNNVSRSGGGESTHQSTKPIWEPHRFNIPVLHPKVNHLKLKAFFRNCQITMSHFQGRISFICKRLMIILAFCTFSHFSNISISNL